MTRVCVFGAGAIGGYLAARLAGSSADVSVVARGPHLAAIRDCGLTLVEDGAESCVPVTATDTPAHLGRQDVVIVALKAHSIPGAVDLMQPLLGPDTAVVFAVNGVPWWYFHGLDGPFRDRRLESVDPGGRIWQGIGPERAVGCVVYTAAEVTSPGTVTHRSGNRFSLGEPDGSRSDRVQALAALFAEAGLKAPVRTRLRDEIWIKLLGNASLNPISALTQATLAQMLDDPATCAVVRRIMEELVPVAEAVGARIGISIDRRIAGARAVGEHRTSMLQDLLAGRPMEIDALVGAVRELAQVAELPVPTLDVVHALVVQRARLAGCYDG